MRERLREADLRSLEEIGNHLDMKLPNVQRRQGKEEIVLRARPCAIFSCTTT